MNTNIEGDFQICISVPLSERLTKWLKLVRVYFALIFSTRLYLTLQMNIYVCILTKIYVNISKFLFLTSLCVHQPCLQSSFFYWKNLRENFKQIIFYLLEEKWGLEVGLIYEFHERDFVFLGGFFVKISVGK